MVKNLVCAFALIAFSSAFISSAEAGGEKRRKISEEPEGQQPRAVPQPSRSGLLNNQGDENAEGVASTPKPRRVVQPIMRGEAGALAAGFNMAGVVPVNMALRKALLAALNNVE